MLKWVGKDITNGAVDRLSELITKTDWPALAGRFPVAGTIIKLIPDIKSGYDKMTAEEKAEFWKNALITGAKIGATI